MLASSRPKRRLVGFLLSLAAFFVGTAFLTAAVLTAARPLYYLHGWAWITAVVVFLVNAAMQLPLALTDRTLGDDLRARQSQPSPVGSTVAALAAAIGALLLAGGAAVLAVRAGDVLRTATGTDVVSTGRGMMVTAICTVVLLLAGAAGLLLSALAPGFCPAAATILHLPLPLGCVLFALYLYFDKSTPRNGTLKLCVSLALLLLALLFLLRIRRLIGTDKPRLALWLARATLPYTGALSISLVCLRIFRGASFVSLTIPLFIGFLSFYFYSVFSAPGYRVAAAHPSFVDATEAGYDPGDGEE